MLCKTIYKEAAVRKHTYSVAITARSFLYKYIRQDSLWFPHILGEMPQSIHSSYHHQM
jgi:hypothetical protein